MAIHFLDLSTYSFSDLLRSLTTFCKACILYSFDFSDITFYSSLKIRLRFATDNLLIKKTCLIPADKINKIKMTHTFPSKTLKTSVLKTSFSTNFYMYTFTNIYTCATLCCEQRWGLAGGIFFFLFLGCSSNRDENLQLGN